MADLWGMSMFGTTSTQHIAALNQVERVNARNTEAKRAAKPDARKRPEDAVEIDVQTVQSADAVRGLKGNTQEETAEDRQAHGRPNEQTKKKAARVPRLDLQG